jgi:hypothetical protein
MWLESVLFGLGVWGGNLRKIPLHLAIPFWISDRNGESIKILQDVIFGRDGEVLKEPECFFQRFICMPCRHQKVIRFSLLKFSHYDAQIDSVMHVLASVAPTGEIGESAANERPEKVD